MESKKDSCDFFLIIKFEENYLQAWPALSYQNCVSYLTFQLVQMDHALIPSCIILYK